MTNISGKLIRPDGQPADGAVMTITLPKAFATPGKITLAGSASAAADAEGQIEISIAPGSEYRLELSEHGRPFHAQSIFVPDCPEVELTDLLDGLEGFVCE